MLECISSFLSMQIYVGGCKLRYNSIYILRERCVSGLNKRITLLNVSSPLHFLELTSI